MDRQLSNRKDELSHFNISNLRRWKIFFATKTLKHKIPPKIKC